MVVTSHDWMFDCQGLCHWLPGAFVTPEKTSIPLRVALHCSALLCWLYNKYSDMCSSVHWLHQAPPSLTLTLHPPGNFNKEADCHVTYQNHFRQLWEVNVSSKYGLVTVVLPSCHARHDGVNREYMAGSLLSGAVRWCQVPAVSCHVTATCSLTVVINVVRHCDQVVQQQLVLVDTTHFQTVHKLSPDNTTGASAYKRFHAY